LGAGRFRIEKQRASGFAVQVGSERFSKLDACGLKTRVPLAIVATARAPERLLLGVDGKWIGRRDVIFEL
jgi:hypothetical protein